ncbi:SHOCT domain-containing protein [Acinetobacter sp. CUI P1]|nr:SHOCT domain-containing protein [Acinetobacter sp. CUI P1]
MSNVNWRIKVADKEWFWDTLETYNGYKFQNNKVIGQFRVVSPDKYREAWGFDRHEIKEDFKRISGKYKQNQGSVAAPVSQVVAQDTDYLEKLRQVAELYKDGVITEAEYEELRLHYLTALKK